MSRDRYDEAWLAQRGYTLRGDTAIRETQQDASTENKKLRIVHPNDKATYGLAPHGERVPTLGHSALSPFSRASSYQGDETMAVSISLPFFAPPSQKRIICQLVFPGDPGTKARPRFNGQVYTPKKTKDAQTYMAWVVRKAYPHLTPNRSHDLGVGVAFFTKTRQRRDIDNLIKLLLDACNGLVWADDVQVTQLTSTVVRGNTNPRTELIVYTIGDGYTLNCETCKIPLQPRGVKSTQRRNDRFCSKACYDEAQRKGQYVFCYTCKARIYKQNEKLKQAHQFCSAHCRALAFTEEKLCRHCHQPFRSTGSRLRGRSFCSQVCREHWHALKRMPSQKPGICPDCGSGSSRTGQRCYACFTKKRWGRPSFTKDEQHTIVQAWQNGTTMNSLAKTYHVSHGAISRVIHALAVHQPSNSQPEPMQEVLSENSGQLTLFVA